MTARLQTGLSVALIVVLGVLCYANSLSNGFVWDDNSNVVKDRFLRSWRFLPRFFTTDVAEAYDTTAVPVPVYRPLYMLSLFVDYQMWGPNPAMFHLTNVAWHILSAVLVYLVFCALRIRQRWALLGSLVYLAHPLHVENVAFVAGRNADMCISFLLLSLLLLLKWCENIELHWRLIGSLVAFALALLAKEVAASFPAIVVAVLVMLPVGAKLPRRQAVVVVGLYGIELAVYMLVRAAVLTCPSFPSLFSWTQRCMLALESWALMIGLAVVPVNLHHERNLPMTGTMAATLAGIGSLALVAAVLLAVRFWRRDRRVTLGIAFALLAFLPTSNLAPLNMTFGERWISWPMVGLLLAVVAERSIKRSAMIPAVLIICVFSVLTISQNRVWHDDITLFRTFIERGGDTVRAQTILACSYLDAGDLDKAQTHFQIILDREPRHVPTLREMGVIAIDRVNLCEAREWFEKALRIAPTDVGTSIWMAYVQEQADELPAAEQTLRRAASRHDSTTAAIKLTEFYLRVGRLDDAERSVQPILDKDSMHAAAQNLLGTVLFRKGSIDKAEEHFRLALRYDRWLVGAHANLAAVADKRGDLAQAVKHYNDALQLDPTNASIYYALGVVLNRHGETTDAHRALARAVELDPLFDAARKLLEELSSHE